MPNFARLLRAIHHLPLITVLLTTSASVSVAQSFATPGEKDCAYARELAAARYSTCVGKALAKFYRASLSDNLNPLLEKCRSRYAASWAVISAKYDSGPCASPARFVHDGSTGVVTDNLTGYQWQRQTDNGSTRDKDNLYTIGTGAPSNGTAYTILLEWLNFTEFGGHADWRIPTLEERLTMSNGLEGGLDPAFGTDNNGIEGTRTEPLWIDSQHFAHSYTGGFTFNWVTGDKVDSVSLRGVRGGLR